MNHNLIDSFSGEYRFLSNFWLSPIIMDDACYPSVEHAYQAAKTLVVTERKMFESGSAGNAKHSGNHLSLRYGWDNMKLGIMSNLLYQKFSNQILRDKLLLTGSAKLVEGNTWGDTYWGVCNGSGFNHLGKLLMQIRDELSGSSLLTME